MTNKTFAFNLSVYIAVLIQELCTISMIFASMRYTIKV